MMSEPVVVLAHQGWDEVLMFAVPIVLLYLGIRWWDGRQRETGERDDDATAGDDG